MSSYQDLSRLIDRRLFRLRNLQGALDGAAKVEIRRAREKYREAVADWNESLNRNLVMTSMYFGSSARQMLEDEIVGGLRELHRLAIVTIKQPTPERVRALKRSSDDFNVRVYKFNAMLLVQLQEGQVGSFLPADLKDALPSEEPDVSTEVEPSSETEHLAPCSSPTAPKSLSRPSASCDPRPFETR